LVENRDFFHISPAFNESLSVRRFPSDYYHNIFYGKTRMLRLLDGAKSLQYVSTQYTNTTY